MKKFLALLAFLLALGLLWAAAGAEVPEETPAQPKKADWTVLLYVCGADLESRHALASEDLNSIMDCVYYYDPQNSSENVMRELSGEPLLPTKREPDRVKVIVQTGGSKEWHTLKYGEQISAARLQRWEYYFDPAQNYIYPSVEFRLREELPLASMAAPETLADFIRWGTENYPAEKYCLVIWGHGNGSKGGVLIDELFGGDRMNLTELKGALAAGGTVFETLVFDACMMGTLETACAVQENARWMVASEEVVTGRGTDINGWLQQLYFCPDCDGKQLGRWVCDMTQIFYANETDKQTQDLLTWSVIDLSKVSRLAELFDRFMENAGRIYASNTWMMYSLISMMDDTEKYGESFEGMEDVGGIFYDPRIVNFEDVDLFRDTIAALSDSVVYSVRGTGRSAARGLSFCYAVNFTDEELDLYAQSCPFRHYLALLDALSPTWSAPETIYETVERLPETNEYPEYTIHAEKKWSSDGIPGIAVNPMDTAFRNVRYSLYRLSEETGNRVFLGSNATTVDAETGSWLYHANEPWMWPTVEDEVCCIEFLKDNFTGSLYSIPLQIGSEFWNLRCGYENDELEIYGLWEGYDADSSVMNRNVMKLSGFTGRSYRLLYPIQGREENDLSAYEPGEWKRVFPSLELTIQPLPPGTYYLEYQVRDLFWHSIPMEPLEFTWDGKKMTFPEELSWEGAIDLKWEGWPQDRENP